MSYIAFALKYRPQNFDQVIGQDHVVTPLKNAIAQNRVHHAYLFSGPRGIGKTSLARIFAKSLNCEKGPTPKPCGKCRSCVEITQGRSLDIMEIDGASNRGIDEIRTLREGVKLSAAGSRYKIYIIDEVHQITHDAFNALLKTLEEPPAHVKFIFATTHPQKVPPTILSRCQKFQFNLIPVEKIVQKLRQIAKEEKITIKDDVLYTIAKAATGSIRDAESLLDQLAPVILEKEFLGDVFSFLGIVDEESLNVLLGFLIAKDLDSLLKFIDRVVKDGKDLDIFIDAFTEHLRNLLLATVSPKNFQSLSEVSPQTKDFIKSILSKVNTNDVLQIIDLLIEAKDTSKRLNTLRIPLELAFIKYCQGRSLNSFKKNDESEIDIQITQQKPKSNSDSKNNSQSEVNTESDTSDDDLDGIDFDTKAVGDLGDQVAVDKADGDINNEDELKEQDNVLLEGVKLNWDKVIGHIKRTRAALASHLSFAQPLFSQGKVVTVAFCPEDYFHKEIVESSKNLKFIEDAFAKLLNKKVGIKFTFSELTNRPKINEATSEIEEKTIQAEPSTKKTDEDMFLNDLLDTFGGKFHTDDE